MIATRLSILSSIDRGSLMTRLRLLAALVALVLPATLPATTICTAQDAVGNTIKCTPVLVLDQAGVPVLPATAANQTAAQAAPGNDAAVATAVQGVTNGRPVGVQIVPDVTVGPVTGVSALNTDLLTNTVSGWYDARDFHSFSFDLFTSPGVSAGVVTFEQTNVTINAPNGGTTNSAGLHCFETGIIAGNPISSISQASPSAVRHFECPIMSRYVRLRLSTAMTGGTVGATAVFSQFPYSATRINVQQATGASLAVSLTAGTITGTTAEDSAQTAAPVSVGCYVRTAVAPTTLVAGDGARLTCSNGAALVTKPYSIGETDWQYAAGAAGIVNTTTAVTAVTMKAAGAASIRNYTTNCTVAHDALGAATELVFRDGAAGTVIYRTKLQTTALPTVTLAFTTPLRGTAATLLEVATLTAVTGGVYVNCQGYQAP